MGGGVATNDFSQPHLGRRRWSEGIGLLLLCERLELVDCLIIYPEVDRGCVMEMIWYDSVYYPFASSPQQQRFTSPSASLPPTHQHPSITSIPKNKQTKKNTHKQRHTPRSHGVFPIFSSATNPSPEVSARHQREVRSWERKGKTPWE